ncbi:Hypothetical predicted protein [Paramuricea clavata]|uniref:ZFAND1-like ubiquitin-like domain-containing protein n=1 Tax=Paramuricea clavata TaxID=317549 RepID=A0A6S7GSC8_PARCT|nr:Hypothetical predicted protein [Paramuricea clavata]
MPRFVRLNYDFEYLGQERSYGTSKKRDFCVPGGNIGALMMPHFPGLVPGSFLPRKCFYACLSVLSKTSHSAESASHPVISIPSLIMYKILYRHRHQPDHSCPKYEEYKNSANEASKQKVQIEKKEKTGRGGARSSSRAAKVALMKMKLHAVGDASTPQEERVYFSIILPDESTEKSKPMFFSKKWSIGRIIDQISKMCKLRNENNRQLSTKLRLFEKFPRRQLTIGKSLETEMNENSETLFSGSELILEYVETDM